MCARNSVAGSPPGVPASDPGPDAEALFNVGDRRLQAGNGVDQVVDHVGD